MSSESTRLRGIFQSIADAIRSKTGKSATMTPDEMPNEITSISGGDTPEVEEKDVNFIDYDGSILYSYTAQEALALTALPANPSHNGLTSQGWNYTLAEVKTEVNAVGGATVGQMYVTDDGKTRLYCRFEEGRTSPKIYIYVNGSVTIDWGDGSTPDALSSTYRLLKNIGHTYTNAGDYVITFTVSSGTFSIYGVDAGSSLVLASDGLSGNGRTYVGSVKKVELGESVILENNAFRFMNSLKSITIPNSVATMPQSFVANDYSLTGIVIPKNVSKIDISCFSNCYKLKRCSIPPSVETIETNALTYCYSLMRVNVPNGVSFVNTGVFNYNNMNEVTFGDTVTTLQSVFYSCPITKVRLPEHMTQFGGVANCQSLVKLIVPECGTTGMSFKNNYSMKEYHFEGTTPASLNSNGFNGIPSDCKIYVPSASLETYKTATNWSAYASYMVGE